MTTKKLSNIIFPLLIVLLALSACTPIQPGAPTAPTLDGTMWNLTGFGSSDALTPPVTNTNISLDFADGQVSGSAGCNGYGASYTLTGNAIQFSTEGFVSTLMFCDPAEIMDQEARYLDWLQKAETVALEGDQLIIHTSEGDLTFVKAQDTALEGTNWQLSGIVEGDTVASSIVDEKINIQFENGQVGGSSGCNQYFADYTLDGEKLTLGVIGGTEMACEDEIAQREVAFLTALGQVTGYQIERSTLTLLDAGGNAMMSFYAGQ
jgi:heat shock protein HslJ